ncbi:NADH:ubiquinone reductase (Na(+)-transporting) subunit F [Alkalimarinus sediminis]|nr:2Fe-2S iron-sulfur cluster binding domain-containing protein [Alkalimarinus sediminis]
MLSFFSSGPKAMQINQIDVAVKSKETILTAALRNGINFPYSCKVGGCAVCKCKLTSGKVKAFSDASYLLSAEEVQEGYILACQSIPKSSDVTIEVDLSKAANRQIRGKVIDQKRLTHDITMLEIQLDQVVIYKAGQYAMLSLDCLPGVSRAYSFASKPDVENNIVRFFIRHVPGGVLSTFINTHRVVDESVEIDSPMGEFFLRPADKHMLMVAGGSGLGPILSILQKAKDEQCNRPVTVLLGARTQADLYCLDDMAEIASSWPNTFNFVPVLSSEPEESTWQGARGFVGEYLERYGTESTQAYLCGPPVMVDDCVEKLASMGIDHSEIYTDRFVSVYADAN